MTNKEFRVICMEDEWSLDSSGNFDQAKIEDTLNALGKEGWSFKAIATRHIPGFASLTYQSIIILERELPSV
jgi:hypothetical protein